MSQKNIGIFYLAYLALGVIWGSNFLFMKWASVHITSMQIVFLRVLFGFLFVFTYALMKRQVTWHHIKYWKHFIMMALLATLIYYYFFAEGTSLLNSGIAGALSGSIPLFSTMLALFFLKDEKVTFRRIIGVIVGLIGVLVIARPWATGVATLDKSGVLYMLIGSLSVGASFVYAKKYLAKTSIAPAALTSYQLLLVILLIVLFGDLEGMGSIQTDFTALVGVVIGLGLLGTGIAYVLYYVIIRSLGAVIASTVTYIPPVISLIIGAFLADEVIMVMDWGGMFLILIGVSVMNNSRFWSKFIHPTRFFPKNNLIFNKRHSKKRIDNIRKNDENSNG